MPLYSFRIGNPEHSGTSEACELVSRDEAWKELTKVCGDLIGEGCRNLKQNSEWSMELLDEADTPLFRIRLVAETLIWPVVLAYLVPMTWEPAFLI